VVPATSVLGRLPVLRAGDTGTIPFKYRDGLHNGAQRYDPALARADSRRGACAAGAAQQRQARRRLQEPPQRGRAAVPVGAPPTGRSDGSSSRLGRRQQQQQQAWQQERDRCVYFVNAWALGWLRDLK